MSKSEKVVRLLWFQLKGKKFLGKMSKSRTTHPLTVDKCQINLCKAFLELVAQSSTESQSSKDTASGRHGVGRILGDERK